MRVKFGNEIAHLLLFVLHRLQRSPLQSGTVPVSSIKHTCKDNIGSP